MGTLKKYRMVNGKSVAPTDFELKFKIILIEIFFSVYFVISQ